LNESNSKSTPNRQQQQQQQTNNKTKLSTSQTNVNIPLEAVLNYSCKDPRTQTSTKLIITFIPINRYIDDIKNKKYKSGVHAGTSNESITLTKITSASHSQLSTSIKKQSNT
jgi:hypothetical protein